jgi:DNA replication protein DnaC
MSQGGTAPIPIGHEESPSRIDPLRDQPAWTTDAATQPYPQPSQLVTEPVCAICHGAGWVKEAVPFGHPNFGVLFPCQCKQAEWARQKAAEVAQLSNLDGVRDKTFATFNPLVPGLREVVPRIRSYALRPDGWLTLLGPYGVGKTHLAAAIAHEALAREEHILFVVVPDLLDHLRATFGPQSIVSYDERFELVRTVSLLILDDLGTESATPWAREKLYQLINHRYNYRLATVVTTNLKPEAIEPRIYSRLCDPICGMVVTIAAQDYRRRQRQSADRSGAGEGA